eukprot:jgi/Botrbrau1/17073/Bobra.31_2s0004.1
MIRKQWEKGDKICTVVLPVGYGNPHALVPSTSEIKTEGSHEAPGVSTAEPSQAKPNYSCTTTEQLSKFFTPSVTKKPVEMTTSTLPANGDDGNTRAASLQRETPRRSPRQGAATTASKEVGPAAGKRKGKQVTTRVQRAAAKGRKKSRKEYCIGTPYGYCEQAIWIPLCRRLRTASAKLVPTLQGVVGT